MPIYEYQCGSCGEVSEQMESINSETTVKTCPKCGKEAHRIMSNTSFQLKGGGWYASGYSCPSSSNSPACSSCPASAGK
jgi:putative FmdB family regulatory protein